MTEKAYKVMARTLAEAGQGPLFGLVGDANVYFADSFVRDHGGRYVAAANENGAVLMALGYASVSGRVGVATVTHGPAVTNTLTALAEGVKTGLPAVLICGDTAYQDRANLQNIPQREALLATGAGFEQVHSADSIAEDLIRALRRALGERRPVALNVPADLLWRNSTIVRRPFPVGSSPPRIVPEGADLDNAVGVLAAARRPVVLAGAGATGPEARQALTRLAERLEAPLATTLKAKDLFRGEAHDLGIFGTLSTPQAVEAILKADCVISFGASLSEHTSAKGAYFDGKRVVQVSARAEDIGRWHVPDVGLLSTPVEAVERLLHWLDEAEIPGSGFRGELPAQGLSRLEVDPDGAEGDRIGYVQALRRLNALLPADRVYVEDAGRHMIRAMQLIDVAEPARFVFTASFGAIGLGMGYAIGAAEAARGHPVVLVCGDGGFMLGGLAEFNTAVRHGTDLIVVLCNDGSYGAEHVQLREKQMDPGISLFDWPDFAPLAEALGGRGVTVRRYGDFTAVEEAVATRDRPLLIELKLDPDEVPFW